MKLHKLAKMVRSKNAGPFEVSLDILFDNYETYEQVVQSGVLTASSIADLYHISPELVQCHLLPLAYAIKFSFPRSVPSGGFHDVDIYGCQMHAPLVELDIPV